MTMRPFIQQVSASASRVAEFSIGFAALLIGYMFFLLIFDNAKFFELVILLFEIKGS